MLHINDVINRLLQDNKVAQLCEKLQVSPAMISTWKNSTNDFTPRKEIAARIQGVYGHTTWPYSSIALTGIYKKEIEKW